MQHESSIFWPRNPSHRVSMVTLDAPSTLPDSTGRLIPRVLKLTDALRDLQTLNLDAHASVFGQLQEQAADALDDIAATLSDPVSIRNLHLRAQALRGAERRQASVDMMEGLEQQLVSFCGPLTSWLGKTRSLYYSAFFATPDLHHQRLCDTADAHLDEAMEELRARVSPDLVLSTFHGFQITHLVAVAGEANLYPKHFAYFLPEDEGVKHAQRKRTVVFLNTYLALFDLIASEESSDLLYVTDGALQNDQTARYLLAWFRGHDLGHSIIQPGTEFAIASRFDRWGSMQLQEVLADTFGYLLCSSSAWQRQLALDTAVLSNVFMLEMLRYMRRSPCEFPDAGAAFIELQYLLQNGHAKLDAARRRITIDSASLEAGMTALARELSQGILHNDMDAMRTFLRRYAPQYNVDGVKTLEHVLGQSCHTLEYEQLVYAHSQNVKENA